MSQGQSDVAGSVSTESVISQLIQLSRQDLMNISDFLHRSGHTRENVSDKTHISLIPHITRHLEREEVIKLENGGWSELLNLKDKSQK